MNADYWFLGVLSTINPHDGLDRGSRFANRRAVKPAIGDMVVYKRSIPFRASVDDRTPIEGHALGRSYCFHPRFVVYPTLPSI